METLSLFLLKSIVISGLLTAWYFVGLRGRRLHQYNRVFLLSILFFSLVIPCLHFRAVDMAQVVPGRFAPTVLFGQQTAVAGMQRSVVSAAAVSQAGALTIAGVIAACISFILFVVLLARIMKVLKMCRHGHVERLDGVKVVLTDSPKAPFTFLGYVFWNRSQLLEDEVGQLIFRHEMTHIAQGHTYDKLISQALSCIFWFNPFYWIIQKELNIVHEFIADEHAVNDRDTEAFAMMLLRSYNNGSYLVPEHHFFSSSVKRRLAMLQNAGAPSYVILRRFIAVPLVAGAVALFSFTLRMAPHDIVPAKKKIVLMLDAGHGGVDEGGRSGSYAEKDICLLYARRIKELSTAYNVEVHLTRDNDQDLQLPERVTISDKVHPDVFISLHVGDAPGTQKEKGDYEIYVAGSHANAGKAGNYSSAIFVAMARDGIIPGHVHSPGCTCSTCTSHSATHTQDNGKILSTEKEGIYVLKHVQAPGMVVILGNIKDQGEMRQLMDNDKVDLLCNAILSGLVEGAMPEPEFNTDPLNIMPANKANNKCR